MVKIKFDIFSPRLNRKLSSNKGFTLVELMVVSLVMIGVIVAIWGVLLTSLNYIALAKEETVAADDLKDVVEKMKSVAFGDITTVFPDGSAVDPDMMGGYTLTDESIVVRYPQGTGIDPVEIEVELTWTRKDGRSRSHIFKVLRTSYI